MLRDAARKLLAAEYPPSVARAAMESPTAHDAGRWSQLAALGWVGLLVPEDLGGQGSGFLEMAVLLEETGSALLPGPFFATAVLGVTALVAARRRRGSAPTSAADDRVSALLAAIARGEHVVAVMLGHDDEPPLTLGADGRVSGRARFVLDAHVANSLLVGAGGRLVRVDPAGPGVTVTPLATVDRTRRLCTVELRDAPTELLADEHRAVDVVTRTRNAAWAGLAVELVGVGQRTLEMAVAYANERTQFGRPIGSFQAIKHKCVDMMVAVETARSLAYYAAWAVGEDAPDAASAAAMAKAYCGDMAKTVTSEAIQVHGGIGFTWEHDLHLYYRRALAADAAFGAEPAHRETILGALGR